MSSTPRALTGPDTEPGDDGPPRLSGWSFGICLGLVLAVFLGLHPLWEPLDIEAVDRNIWWSYVPIPLLVLVALRIERKLNGASWFLETFKLTLVKFGITYVGAHVLWAIVGPPQGLGGSEWADHRDPVGLYAPREAPPPTDVPRALTGRIEGVVTDAAGAPVAGAHVFVADGLRGVTYAPPTETVELVVGAAGVQPPVAVVQAFQPVVLRSASGSLHTVRALASDGRRLFNYAVPPGSEKPVMFKREHGVVELGCRVPDHRETAARLVVVAGPFVVRTDASGAFRLDGVPAGARSVEAWLLDAEGLGVHATLEVAVEANAAATADLVLR